MNKKRIFGIILFILIGFFMFTFANPNEEVKDEKGKTNVEDKFNKEKKDKKGMDVVNPVEVDKRTTEQSLVEREVRVQSPTENNIPSVQPVDNTKEIEAKLELEKAKKAAIEELENYKKEYNYSNLSDRDTTVYEYTKAINDAKDTSDVDRILIDAKDAIDKLVKEDLTRFIKELLIPFKKAFLNSYNS